MKAMELLSHIVRDSKCAGSTFEHIALWAQEKVDADRKWSISSVVQ